MVDCQDHKTGIQIANDLESVIFERSRVRRRFGIYSVCLKQRNMWMFTAFQPNAFVGLWQVMR
jgi:hypothetical protein